MTTIQDTGDVLKTIVTTIQLPENVTTIHAWPDHNPIQNNGLTKLLGSSLLSEIDWSVSIDIFQF